MKDCDALLTVPYFSGLKDEIVCSILEHSFVKKLKIGEHLFMADEICDHLFIIKKGLIEIFQIGGDGNKIIMHHAGVGAVLGDIILFNDEKYGAHACSLEDSEILSIEKKGFEELIYANPEICMRMLADFGKRIKKLMYFTAEIALKDVRKRIVRLILELVKDRNLDKEKSITITDIPTQDEMAHRIGTVREVLCRGLHKLEEDKLIKVKRGIIIVNDINKLKEMVSLEEDESLFPITLPMKGL